MRIGEMCEGGDGRYDRPRHRKSSDMIAYLVVFFGFGFEEDGSNHDSGSKSPRLSDDWDAEGNVFFFAMARGFRGMVVRKWAVGCGAEALRLIPLVHAKLYLGRRCSRCGRCSLSQRHMDVRKDD